MFFVLCRYNVDIIIFKSLLCLHLQGIFEIYAKGQCNGFVSCIFFAQRLQQPCRLRPGGGGALSDLSKEGCPERRGEPRRFNALSICVDLDRECAPMCSDQFVDRGIDRA